MRLLVRVLGMGTANITNAVPVGTKGLLAQDSKDKKNYFMPLVFVFSSVFILWPDVTTPNSGDKMLGRIIFR